MIRSGCPIDQLPSNPLVLVWPLSVATAAYPPDTAAASCRYRMAPAEPPEPMPWKRPLHASAGGSHTSNRISEPGSGTRHTGDPTERHVLDDEAAGREGLGWGERRGDRFRDGNRRVRQPECRPAYGCAGVGPMSGLGRGWRRPRWRHPGHTWPSPLRPPPTESRRVPVSSCDLPREG